MAVTLRYFTEFGKPALQKTICGGIYARVYCIFSACTMSSQRRFTFAISSTDEFLVVHMSGHYLNIPHPFGLHIISILFSKLKTSSVLILNVWQAWKILIIWSVLRLWGFRLLSDGGYSVTELCVTIYFKKFYGICDINLLFKLGVSVTRDNSCKLVKTSCNTNAVKYFYTNRIVLAWNSLSDSVVTASSVNAFRK